MKIERILEVGCKVVSEILKAELHSPGIMRLAAEHQREHPWLSSMECLEAAKAKQASLSVEVWSAALSTMTLM